MLYRPLMHLIKDNFRFEFRIILSNLRELTNDDIQRYFKFSIFSAVAFFENNQYKKKNFKNYEIEACFNLTSKELLV